PDLQGWPDCGPACRRDPGSHLASRVAEVESDMTEHAPLEWTLLVLGLVIAGIGLVWILAPSIPWLGRLPGDIRIERGNFHYDRPDQRDREFRVARADPLRGGRAVRAGLGKDAGQRCGRRGERVLPLGAPVLAAEAVCDPGGSGGDGGLCVQSTGLGHQRD